MPQLRTRHFDTIEYDEAAVLTFPSGLPAFEHLAGFVLIEHAASAPLVFLQSLEDANVCLPVLPLPAIDPDYELSLNSEDLETLGFGVGEGMERRNDIAVFAIISIPESGPATANLLAPVVVNPAAHRAVQAVRSDTRYSHQHPIVPAGEGVCS